MRGEMSDAYHTMKPDADRGPVPAHSTFGEHVWILPRALAAQALQQVSYWIFPSKSSSSVRARIVGLYPRRLQVACLARIPHLPHLPRRVRSRFSEFLSARLS